ncbi:MAG: C4-dicarboxylate ABC transporter permease [Sneathiella sp.]|nr:MAG: C4-dicarboxylate ABC transporter permease [Sneathiella sp.]
MQKFWKPEIIVATFLGAFILYTSATGPFVLLVHRSVFLALVILLGIIVYPLFKESKLRPLGIVIDCAIAVLAVTACLRVALDQDHIMMDYPIAEMWDIILSWGLVASILELCRRTVGWVFTSIVIAGILYAMFGEYAPGSFEHRGFSLQFITETIYLGDLGIWGGLVGISATVLAAFVMFGSLLLFSGAGQTFIDMATRVGGASPGGAAKVATIASGLFGMLAGSSVANVATTGNVTIPMMKRLKYPPALAAGIEAVASTGGQLAPPILGAAAFVMAEFLGISYWTIVTAAIVPAVLYYLGVYVTVHVLAVRTGLGVVSDEEMPSWKQAFAGRRVFPLLAGIGGITFGIVNGNSIVFAVFLGMAGLSLAYIIVRVRNVETAKEVSVNLAAGFVDASKGLVMVGILLAGAQVLVSLINMTGLAGTISALVMQIAGDDLFILGLVTAAICLIMGMGLPTIAAYVLVAAIMVGPLTHAGVSDFTAHMFVLYYAALSAITPPVCIAVFIAAGIARTAWTGVAVEAIRLGAITYLLPMLFLYYPALLNQGDWPAVIYAGLTGLVVTISLSYLLGGASIFNRPVIDRLILLMIIVMGAYDNLVLTLIAVGGVVGIWVLAKKFPDFGKPEADHAVPEKK